MLTRLGKPKKMRELHHGDPNIHTRKAKDNLKEETWKIVMEIFQKMNLRLDLKNYKCKLPTSLGLWQS